jgi:hypothetical protein
MARDTAITTADLSTMADGAVQEAFKHEFQASVLPNLIDPNTDCKPRTIIITLKFVPNERRDRIEYLASVSSKLRPAEAVDGEFLVGKRGGRVTASEYVVVQEELELETAEEGARA